MGNRFRLSGIRFCPQVARWLLCLGGLALAGSSLGQVTTTWLNPSGGDWDDSSNWSTPAFPDNAGQSYVAVLGDLGPAYTVQADLPITLDALTVGADASLYFTENLSIESSLEVDGLLAIRTNLFLDQPMSIGGAGEIRVGTQPIPGGPSIGNSIFLYGNADPDATTTLSGDTTIRFVGSSGGISHYTGFLKFRNEGTIWADGQNASISSTTSFENAGLLRVSDGATLYAFLRTGTTVGDIQIDAGGKLRLDGFGYDFDRPTTIGSGQTLELSRNWTASSLLTIDGGTLVLKSTEIDSPNLVFQNAAELHLDQSGFVLPDILNLPLGTDTTVRVLRALDLDAGTLDLANAPGLWDMSQGTFYNGTIANTGGVLRIGDAGSTPDTATNYFRDVALASSVDLVGGTMYTSDTVTFEAGGTIGAGSRLILREDWQVAAGAGLSVNGGQLHVYSDQPGLNQVVMNGGELGLGFATTWQDASFHATGADQLTALSGGVLDLESADIDLSTLPFTLSLAGGELTNGTIRDVSGLKPLIASTSHDKLSNLVLDADVLLDNRSISTYLVLDNVVANQVVFGLAGPASSSPLRYRYRMLNGTVLNGVTLQWQTAFGGAVIRNGLDLQADSYLDSNALVTFDGTQTLTGDAVLTINWLQQIPGTLRVINGDLTIDAGVTIRAEYATSTLDAAGQTVHLLGRFETTDGGFSTPGTQMTLTADRFHQVGTVSVGGIGLLIQANTWDLEASATTEFVLPPTPSLAPRIEFGGTVQLQGALELAAIENVNGPYTDASYLLLSAQAITGGFDQVPDGPIYFEDQALFYELTQTSTQLWLAIDAVTAGDMTGDGLVDAEDLALLLSGWGQGGSPWDYAQGEWTGDGIVDQDDLNYVLRRFGNTPPDINVPEPSGLALLGFSALALMTRRRGR